MNRQQKTILVTAFEPFGADALNPTQLILDRLPEAVGGCAIGKLLLPVEFIGAYERASAAYDALSPAAVILLGQAGGRSAVTPETAAKNIVTTAKPDNAGYVPASAVIAEGAPDSLTSTLPIDRIVEAIRARGVPAEASDDAGDYVCNRLFYTMLLHNSGSVPTGFIHVPFIREQGHEEAPYLEFDDAYTAVLAAIEAVADALLVTGLDMTRLSARYTVRRMNDSDADGILALCRQNTQYYQYCGKQPTKELILHDLHITPPGIAADDKYYVGFYEGTVLTAVMDLIDGYPEGDRCFIGFFMMNRSFQNKGIGSQIIRGVCAYLKGAGYTSVMLGIDKENPQSNHFWQKNGFAVVREVEQDGGIILVAEKTL